MKYFIVLFINQILQTMETTINRDFFQKLGTNYILSHYHTKFYSQNKKRIILTEMFAAFELGRNLSKFSIVVKLVNTNFKCVKKKRNIIINNTVSIINPIVIKDITTQSIVSMDWKSFYFS